MVNSRDDQKASVGGAEASHFFNGRLFGVAKEHARDRPTRFRTVSPLRQERADINLVRAFTGRKSYFVLPLTAMRAVARRRFGLGLSD